MARALTGGAIGSNAAARAGTGAMQKHLPDSQIKRLIREFGGIEGARSKIADTEYAGEVWEQVRPEVVGSAALKVIEVFRSTVAQGVLGLLGGVGVSARDSVIGIPPRLLWGLDFRR